MNDEPAFDPRRRNAIRDLIVTTARGSAPRRSPRTHAAAIAALVVLAVGLSGGVAYAIGTGLLEPNPVVSIAPAPTETPSSAPTIPTPTVTTSTTTPSTDPMDAADPGTWIIGFDGVGPVKLGPSFEDQRQVLPSFTDITDPLCVGDYLNLEAPNGFSLLFVGGPDKPVVTAAITFGDNSTTTSDDRASTPKTSAGIGIDSTQEELLTAYPGIQQTGSYQSDEYPYYGLTDENGGWIVFGISHGKVGRIQIANEATLPMENRSVKTLPSERCPA